jgi:hypothetical protein
MMQVTSGAVQPTGARPAFWQTAARYNSNWVSRPFEFLELSSVAVCVHLGKDEGKVLEVALRLKSDVEVGIFEGDVPAMQRVVHPH